MTTRLIEGRPSMAPTGACRWLSAELGISASPSTIRRMCDRGELRHVLVEVRTPRGTTRTERHTIGEWLRDAFTVDTGADAGPSIAEILDGEEDRTAAAMAQIEAIRKGGRR